MQLFDTQHLGWPFILLPAIVIAAAISLDNRHFGPYFAIVDVVFNDFGSGYSWHDKEILLSFVRRAGYIILMGVLLNVFHYRMADIAGVFVVAGFLMLWPAFGHPLPVYARKSDWQVLLVWALYVASVVSFGLFGARAWAIIGAIAGQKTWEFIRGNIVWGVVWFVGGIFFTAYRAGLQVKLGKRSWQDNYPDDSNK